MRLAAALLLLFPLTAFAQSTEISLFLGGAGFDETSILFIGPLEADADLVVENGGSIALSINHYWRSPRFSTELAIIGIGGDPTVRLQSGPIETKIDAGTIGLGVITGSALWHFRNDARVRPYIGAGLALIGGEIEAEIDEQDIVVEETVELEGAGALLLQGGVDIRMADRWTFAIDAKAIPYSPMPEDDAEVENFVSELDLNPFILGFGVRYRF